MKFFCVIALYSFKNKFCVSCDAMNVSPENEGDAMNCFAGWRSAECASHTMRS